MTPAENASIAMDCLGSRLTAFAIGTRSPAEVRRIASGKQGATTIQTGRLEQLAEWVTILRKLESDQTIRALSMGMWPSLNDQAPIELFHNGEGLRAVSAARSYD